MILTTIRAAEIMETHRKTIQRLCKSGELKAHKKLGKWYILQSDLIEFITN